MPSSIDNSNLEEACQRLDTLLEEEFELLKDKNISSLTTIQEAKVDLLKSIEELWSTTQKTAQQSSKNELETVLGHVRTMLKACKEKHMRNDILLRKQIDETRNILSTLTHQTKEQNVTVYNKVGRLIR